MRQPSEIIINGRTLADILAAHRKWRIGEDGGERANLAGANLARAYLAGANLADANLADANLAGANLADANLAHACLAGANLADANLADANLADANLEDACLAGANLADANLADANLADATGNMREVKSAQFDRWGITWITAPDSTVTVQIGCQRHSLDLWRKSDPRWIAAMDPNATEWWDRYRDVVLALIEASPAVPYGAPKEAG